MKSFITIALLWSLPCMAQKVDLDRFYFNANFQQLPQYPLDTSYRTYSVDVQTGPYNRANFRPDLLEQQVVIDGWKRLAYRAHIHISLVMEDAVIEKTETMERVEPINDRNGKPVGKRSHFFTQVTYSFAAKATINDFRGRLINENVLADRNCKQVFNTSEYDSRADAEAYFKFNFVTVTNQVNQIAVNMCVNNLSNELSTWYGYHPAIVSDFMWILDSRKHPEYDAHRNAWLTVKQAMFAMQAEQSLDRVRAMMQPAIDYFNKVKRMYTSNSKADRKLRYASFYNLAKIYYYLDDPESAMREATALELNDFDARDGRSLQMAATQLRALLQQSGRSSRHFPLNLQLIQGPSMASK